VTDLSPSDSGQQDLDRRMRIVRLGQGVDRTGALAPEALARTFAACEEYAAVCRDFGAVRLRCCATSAVRDAANAAEFAAGVRERLGVEPEVISGAAEARLSADGAVRGLAGLTLPEPLVVLDIGGGSTELVVVSRAAGRASLGVAVSMDVGSVRLTERHLHHDPPDAAEVAAARADVDAALDTVASRLGQVATLVGVAGTITTLAALALGLRSYDSTRIHRSELPFGVVVRACAEMVVTPVDMRRAMPFMHPGRADVIGGGALVLERVVHRLAPRLRHRALVVSEHDILDGIAWSLV